MHWRKFQELIGYAKAFRLNYAVRDYGHVLQVCGIRYDKNGEQWRHAIAVHPGYWTRKHSPSSMVWNMAQRLEARGYAAGEDGEWATRFTEEQVRRVLHD
jgi:hypothetical protein